MDYAYKYMKHMKQLMIILGVTLLSEILKVLLPFPIPTSIYGILLLLFALGTGILRLEQIKETGKLLIGIMPLLLIPASVGLMVAWKAMGAICLQIILISTLTTFLVMVVSGRVTQFIIRQEAKKKHERIDL